METTITSTAALLFGFLLDRIYGDPERLPHPVVGFGKAISFCEKRLNRGRFSLQKGASTTIILVSSTFFVRIFCGKILRPNFFCAFVSF